MSEPNKPIPVTLSVDDVRATLIFLSVAKNTYEFVGRMTGDGDERFAQQRITIEALSIAYRTILSNAAKAVAERTTRLEDQPARAPEDIDG